MKPTSIFSILVLVVAMSPAILLARGGGGSTHTTGSGSHYVAPHTTKNGTYVDGHYQSNPNGTKADNWSTKGNVNPYTGEEGKTLPGSTGATESLTPRVPPAMWFPTYPRIVEPARDVAPSTTASTRATPRSKAEIQHQAVQDRESRSRAMRSAFQHLSPCPSTARSTGSCPGYIVDHVVPLCAQGPDLPSNMQWQTVAEAKQKDVGERKSCKH